MSTSPIVTSQPTDAAMLMLAEQHRARRLPPCCREHSGPHLHGCIRLGNHAGACILPAR